MKYDFDRLEFCEAWQRSKSPREVAQRLSMLSGQKVKERHVIARAERYQEAGVNLKTMVAAVAAA